MPRTALGRVEPLGLRSWLDETAALRDPRAATQFSSELDLVRNAERIVNLDPEITDGAFELRMSKEKLSRPQVAGLLVNLTWFCPSHRVGTIGWTVETSACHPSMDNASVLSRRDVRPLPKPVRKEVSPAPGTKTGKPILDRCACLLGYFELNWPTCVLLNHRRSVSHPAADT